MGRMTFDGEAENTVPDTINVPSRVRVMGAVAQPFAMAESVNVYGVGVRKSNKLLGVYSHQFSHL
jgi:hypothetical protein